MTTEEYEKLKQLYIDVEESLTLTDILDILEENGFYANMQRGDEIRFNSADYNIDDPKGINLCYYVNSKSFYSFSHDISYNIYSLLQKRWELLGNKVKRTAILKYICEYKKIPFTLDGIIVEKSSIYNWKSDLNKYLGKQEDYEEKIFDNNIIDGFEKVYHQSWIDDGISIETMDKFNIRWYQYKNLIIIPCYNDNNELIGIRTRNVNKEIDIKYMPLKTLNGSEYNFPTNRYLYGLNKTKDEIQKQKRVIIVEAEKGVLQYESMFDKNICVALYGHAMSCEKRDLILELGVNEVVIALDFDYENVGDNELWNKFKDNVMKIAEYFKGYCKVTALVTYKEHELKCSPTDMGKKELINLIKNREIIYE